MTNQELRLVAIDIFGNHTISAEEVRAALALDEGQVWQHDLLEPAWERVAAAFELQELRLTPVGYGDERIFLSVDLVEADAPLFEWHTPAGNLTVPDALIEVLGRYNETREAFWKLGRSVEERVSPEGHFESCDEALLRIERQAAHRLDAALEVALAAVRDSDDEALRAGLAYLLGWASNKQRVVDTLLDALVDESSWVRNNAARALLPLALRAARSNDLVFPTAPLIRLLEVPSAADRARAVALLQLLALRAEVRNQLRATALPQLRVLAQSRQPNNAAPARTLLALLDLDAPAMPASDQVQHEALVALAYGLATAASPADVAPLLDPDPMAPVQRQLAESVFAPHDPELCVILRLHATKPVGDGLVEALLALDLSDTEGERQSALRFTARRHQDRWTLWRID